jgi:hypothetical protein
MLFEIITDVLEVLCGRGAGVMVAVCRSVVLTLNWLNDLPQCKYWYRDHGKPAPSMVRAASTVYNLTYQAINFAANRIALTFAQKFWCSCNRSISLNALAMPIKLANQFIRKVSLWSLN